MASTRSTGIGFLDVGSKDNSASSDVWSIVIIISTVWWLTNCRQVSLLEYLDLSQLNCLNEAEGHSFKSIVASKSRNSTGSYLLSDADEQLLLNIPVCVKGILYRKTSPLILVNSYPSLTRRFVSSRSSSSQTISKGRQKL